MNAWRPPEEAPLVPWPRIAESLRLPQLGPNPHKLSPRIPENPRRAAVGVILWGEAAGARKLVLVQRGFGAPQHPGEIAFPGGMVEPGDRDLPATARREVAEELGLAKGLWELGCFPDGVAKAQTRGDEVITAVADLDRCRHYTETLFDFDRYRMPERYGLIVERRGAVPPPEEEDR